MCVRERALKGGRWVRESVKRGGERDEKCKEREREEIHNGRK